MGTPANRGPVITALGVRWQIDLSAYPDPPALKGLLSRLWSRSTTEANGDEPIFRPVPATGADSDPSAPVVPQAPPEAFPYAFSRALTLATIRRRAGSALLLHAAGLASGDGARSVALVAPSGGGKSTASRVLGAGYGYLSDELISVEADYTTGAYPKPLSQLASGYPDGKEEHSADELGLGPTPTKPPSLAAIILLDRDPALTEPVLRQARVLDVLADLVAQSSSLWLQKDPLQHLIASATRGGGPYVLRYSEIGECRELIGSVLDQEATSTAEAPKWDVYRPAAVQRWQGSCPARDPVRAGGVVRAPWTDAVGLDGEIALLLGPQLARLAGVGRTIWVEAVEPVSLDRLTVAAEREHGSHPDSAALVHQAVQDLLRGGVLIPAKTTGDG